MSNEIDIPNGWVSKSLGSMGSFFGGVTSISKDDYGHGTPFLQFTNVFNNTKVDISSLQKMNVNEKDLVKRDCLYGDIFFTASSETDNEVAMSSVLLDTVENLTFNGFCKRYRLHTLKELNPNFARYYFRSKQFRGLIKQVVTGDVRFNISQDTLSKIDIVVPDSISEQKAMANVLTAFDDKIELLQQQNETLETMAQSIFKEWFGKYKVGDVLPEGWKVGELNELIEIKYGKDHKKLNEGNIPVYGSGGIMRYVDSYLYNNHSILIPRKGTLSNLYYITEPFWSVDTMFYSKIKNRIQGRFCYLFLKSINLSSMNVGSAVPSLTTSLLNQIQLIIPENKIMKEFDDLISSLYEKVEFNASQIQTLKQTRDTLLPKLMSGQVRVKM